MYETVRDFGRDTGDPAEDQVRHEYLAEMEATQQAVEPAHQAARPTIAPADDLIAQTLRMYRAGAEPAEGNQSLAELTETTLGFELPADWSGRVQVQANVEVEHDGERFVEPAGDREPEFWGVYAHHASGGHQWLADFAGPDAQTNAEALADRLAVIDAYATANEYEQAAKFARIHEERVRRDPNSTDEDRVAAKEARKAAEGTAMLHDEDLQRRIADYEREQQEMAQAMNAAEQPAAAQAPAKPERAYLNVPFKEKDEVKALGARWDRQERAWYVPAGVDPAPFAKWAREGATAAVEARAEAQATQPTAERPNAAQARVYLAVPYGERQVAKAAGAQWDKVAKSWYAGPNADMGKLQRWLPDNVPTQQSPAVTPEDEFAEALKSMGCVVTPGGGHPIMDGKKHRIETEGDKKGEKSGFYVGHLDGHPAGYIKNNRTGVEMKWKAKGYALDPAEKAKMQAEAAAKLAARAEEQERLHEATAQRIGRQAQSLVPITEPTPYLRDKGLQLHAGILTDQEGQKTYIPAYDADGKQWTMQYIQEDGTKRFAKDSRKEGCFHVVGGMDALAAAPALVIGEGYATAATVAEALGHATVAAFDSGNLQAVAEALHAKFPDKPVVIAGDDDRQVQITQGVNPGRTKAQEAAKAVGGKAIFPIFAPGETAYPKELPPITPESYRNHLHAEKRLADAAAGKVQLSEADTAKLKESLLSDDQLAALSNMKKHTDFNDLSERSSLGKDGVERQVRSAVGKVLLDEGQRQKVQQLKQQEIEQQEQRQRRARTY
ncbi:toprim domain-containing protein [Escherichia coli]